MNATTILMIIEIIKLLQATQIDEEIAKAIVDKFVDGKSEDKALIVKELQTIDIYGIISDIMEFIGKLFGKKE